MLILAVIQLNNTVIQYNDHLVWHPATSEGDPVTGPNTSLVQQGRQQKGDAPVKDEELGACGGSESAITMSFMAAQMGNQVKKHLFSQMFNLQFSHI